MKNVVIFGATGNVGVYVVDYLKNNLNLNFYNIIAIGRKNTSFFKKQNLEYYQVDIQNKESFKSLPKPDIVVHLAGVLPAYLKEDSNSSYITTNVLGTFNILEYCRNGNAQKILYSQSYADINANIDVNPILHPYAVRNYKYSGDHALYIFSKNMAVDMIEYYHQTYGINNIILRLPNIYLYHPETTYFVDGITKIIPYRYMINRAIRGEPIEIWGNPKKAKDIVYVKDFAQMIYRAILSNVESAIYNVGTGIATTLDDQVKGIISVFSKPQKVSKIIYNSNKCDALSYIMDIENAKKELNYRPKYDYISYLKDYKYEMEENRFGELWNK